MILSKLNLIDEAPLASRMRELVPLVNNTTPLSIKHSTALKFKTDVHVYGKGEESAGKSSSLMFDEYPVNFRGNAVLEHIKSRMATEHEINRLMLRGNLNVSHNSRDEKMQKSMNTGVNESKMHEEVQDGARKTMYEAIIREGKYEANVKEGKFGPNFSAFTMPAVISDKRHVLLDGSPGRGFLYKSLESPKFQCA